jgi:hypothetical protein
MESLKFWNTDEFDFATYKWRLKERINKEILGNATDPGNCYYTFNELGFRGDSVKKKGLKIMSVGCGHTEGIDVNDRETWSHHLTRMLPNGVDFNLGISGGSNDYIARSVLTWTEYLNPAIVLIMYTYPTKREIYTDAGNLEPYHPIPWGYLNEDLDGRKLWSNIISSTSNEEDYINWYKNHLLISNYLKNKQIPFIWNGTFVKTKYMDENRFDGEYPYFIDNNKYANSIQNELYAKKLLTYFENNFEM